MKGLRRRRVKAAWADIGVLLVAFVVYAAIAGGIEIGGGHIGISLMGVPFGLFVAFTLFYFFIQELVSGQTLGKRWQGIRVTQHWGRLSFRAAALRTLLRLVDWLPAFYLVGYIAIRASGDRARRLGDIAAGTSIRLAEETEVRPAMSQRAVAALLALVAATTLGLSAIAAAKDQEDDFLTEAEAICTRLEQESQPLNVRFNRSVTGNDAVDPLLKLQRVVAVGAADLGDLDPPDSFAPRWERYVASMQQLGDLTGEAADAAARENHKGFERAFAKIDQGRTERAILLAGEGFAHCD